MELYFITGNQGKFNEVKEILKDVCEIKQLDIDLPEIQEIDPHKIIKDKLNRALETQINSSEKIGFIVEDTSLYLDALNGLPGPLIKWFEKTIENKGIYKIAKSFGNLNAEAKTIVGIALPNQGGGVKFFEGSIWGEVCSPQGTGFGWDPIFKPEGYERCFGKFSKEEKNKISMRKKALEKLKDYLMSVN